MSACLSHSPRKYEITIENRGIETGTAPPIKKTWLRMVPPLWGNNEEDEEDEGLGLASSWDTFLNTLHSIYMMMNGFRKETTVNCRPEQGTASPQSFEKRKRVNKARRKGNSHWFPEVKFLDSRRQKKISQHEIKGCSFSISFKLKGKTDESGMKRINVYKKPRDYRQCLLARQSTITYHLFISFKHSLASHPSVCRGVLCFCTHYYS